MTDERWSDEFLNTMRQVTDPVADNVIGDVVDRHDMQILNRILRSLVENDEIVPVWRRRMLPLYWLFKRYLAQLVGQANLPFDMEEAQRGIASYIDTIDFECDDLIDVRGWVRVFEESGERWCLPRASRGCPSRRRCGP